MADPDVEARLQEFINQPGSRGSQLRDAFAQLIALNQREAIPAEALWAAQARGQWPVPDPEIIRPRAEGDSTTTDLPMRRIEPQPEQFLRQAIPGTATNLDNPWRSETPPPEPFGGKGLVIGRYEPPKKKQKKGKG
jgi:hypothetical protein